MKTAWALIRFAFALYGGMAVTLFAALPIKDRMGMDAGILMVMLGSLVTVMACKRPYHDLGRAERDKKQS